MTDPVHTDSLEHLGIIPKSPTAPNSALDPCPAVTGNKRSFDDDDCDDDEEPPPKIKREWSAEPQDHTLGITQGISTLRIETEAEAGNANPSPVVPVPASQNTSQQATAVVKTEYIPALIPDDDDELEIISVRPATAPRTRSTQQPSVLTSGAQSEAQTMTFESEKAEKEWLQLELRQVKIEKRLRELGG